MQMRYNRTQSYVCRNWHVPGSVNIVERKRKKKTPLTPLYLTSCYILCKHIE